MREIDKAAYERRGFIIRQMMRTQGVTEELKDENQMLWAGRMNNICSSADRLCETNRLYLSFVCFRYQLIIYG